MIGVFPYVTHLNFNTTYVGSMVVEYMYGGAFVTHLVLLSNCYIIKNRKHIDKTLYCYSIVSLISALILVILIGNEGGLIKRYFFDFMYLLYIPSIINTIVIFKNNKSEMMGFYVDFNKDIESGKSIEFGIIVSGSNVEPKVSIN